MLSFSKWSGSGVPFAGFLGTLSPLALNQETGKQPSDSCRKESQGPGLCEALLTRAHRTAAVPPIARSRSPHVVGSCSQRTLSATCVAEASYAAHFSYSAQPSKPD